MSDETRERRVWVSWYNRPREFDNGIVWFRCSVRLCRWHRLGGLWFSRDWPFFRVLIPHRSEPRAPIRAGAER